MGLCGIVWQAATMCGRGEEVKEEGEEIDAVRWCVQALGL